VGRGANSKMSKEYTLTTPEDFINAWCGTQTSSFSDSHMHNTEAQDLLLCSFGATPRDTSANFNVHAGAARWLHGKSGTVEHMKRLSLSRSSPSARSSASPGDKPLSGTTIQTTRSDIRQLPRSDTTQPPRLVTCPTEALTAPHPRLAPCPSSTSSAHAGARHEIMAPIPRRETTAPILRRWAAPPLDTHCSQDDKWHMPSPPRGGALPEMGGVETPLALVNHRGSSPARPKSTGVDL